MVLQNIVIPKEINEVQELYVRGTYCVDKNNICINALNTITTDTYMNYFDIGLWKKYTDVKAVQLGVFIKGKGKIVVHHSLDKQDKILKIVPYDSNVVYQLEIYLDEILDLGRGYLWIECIAKECTSIEKIEYCTNPYSHKEVLLTLIICTYHRREELEKNLKILQSCELLQNNLLQVKVVDNGEELENIYGQGIEVYQNPNTGGSGGFKRGMEETVKDCINYATTNVILMDDDVIFELEIFQRIYSFLCFQKKLYETEVIAGRMFRLDNKSIQYTAVEHWNGGDIIHVWGNLDMRDKDNLYLMNDNTNGEYSGWWLATFPIEFIRNNKPLPFFLHCDDVEFGLRHGGNPIIMNGVHVWHETFEYRQSPMIVYYDTRNSLIVNEMYGKEELCITMCEYYIKQAELFCKLGQWSLASSLLTAIRDYQDNRKVHSYKVHSKDIFYKERRNILQIASLLIRIRLNNKFNKV